MSIEKIRALNPNIKIYTTADSEFSEYGAAIDGIDTEKIINAATVLTIPKGGTQYTASEKAFEELACAREITENCYGELDAEIGYCSGENSLLNALEWHTSDEINIAVTDFILLLAKRCELRDYKIDSSKVKAFYIKKGEIISVYSTSLHFCPCQTENGGFGSVVILPRGTNTPLEGAHASPYLFRKNKWIIAHNENRSLIERGVMPGIGGENIKINY